MLSTVVGVDTLQTTNVADGDTVQSIQEPPVEPTTDSTISAVSGTAEVPDASTGQRVSVGVGPWATKIATPRIE